MNDVVAALQTSVDHLRTIVDGLGPDRIRQSAYPSEWTVADTLSHLGSGAVIMRRGFEDSLAGRDADGDFNQSVWDEWNAKSPDDQAADALEADAALMAALGTATDSQREAFHAAMGPMTLDFATFAGLRLNEHVLHTWDVEVVDDPGAVLMAGAVPLMISGVGLIVGFAGRTPGTDTTVSVRTTEPGLELAVVMTPDSVALTPSEPATEPDLTLPAEAFIRLVYGRLDPDHTPPGVGGPAVEQLRLVFPGV